MKHYIPLILLFIVTLCRILVWAARYQTPAKTEFKQVEPSRIQQIIINRVEEALPSPHSELLLGMTIGIDNLGRVKRFKEFLVTTGTIHVVVVSGFNINLVFEFIKKSVGSTYRRRNLVFALSATLLYAIIAGFQPPVIRAWIMCAVANLGKLYGRAIDQIQVLLFTGMVMVAIAPNLIISLSFQLSFMASFGLVVVNPVVLAVFEKVLPKNKGIVQDLATTLSANIAVWPLISLNFGRISLIGLLVNPLILWTVPIITVLGLVALPFVVASHSLAVTLGILLYPLLNIVVKIIEIFGKNGGNIGFQASRGFVIFYYISLILVTNWLTSRIVKKSTCV